MSIKINSQGDVEKYTKNELKAYIVDLEESVKINKEIMQKVLMSTDMEGLAKQIVITLQREVDKLNSSIEHVHREKMKLLVTLEEVQKQRDDDNEILKDKTKKFETYVSKWRQDFEERNRTIDQQAKALDKLRPIVERFEREMETKEGKTSVRDSNTSRRKRKTTENKQSEAKNTVSSMESIEIEELIHENEQLASDLGKKFIISSYYESLF